MAFPEAHRRRIHSTNPLERLLGAVLLEQDEEWQVADRCYLKLDEPETGELSSRAVAAAE